MPRLPQPGKDAGEWGTILNDFLSSSLAADGSLKSNTVGSSHLQADSVTNSAIAPSAVTAASLAPGAVTTTALSDGAITTSKISDGSITAAKVAADVATQAELDVLAASKLDVGVASSTYLATIESERRERARRVLDSLRNVQGVGIGYAGAYATTTDMPTVVHNSTGWTLTTNITESFPIYSGTITTLGATGLSWDSTFGYLKSTTNGTDGCNPPWGVVLTGSEMEIRWRAAFGGESLWIWVDGKPTTPVPSSPAGITVSPGAVYYTKITFASASTRRIEIYPTSGQFMTVRHSNSSASLAPLPKKSASVFCVGDSFLGGSALVPFLQTWGRRLAFATGMEVYQQGQGGTGYISPGSFGARPLTNSNRLDPIIEADPDLCLIYIGGNDRLQAPSAVGAAAETVYDYLNTRAPKVPIIVAGTYPSNATDTVSSQHASVNKVIRDATLLHSNVIGFIDPCGHATTGTVPSALVNGATYSVGQLFSYQGAIYEVLSAHTSGSSPHGRNTKLLTWLTGTGTASAPAGNGNRDTLLSSDGVHWTLDGAGFTAAKLASEAERIIDAYLK